MNPVKEVLMKWNKQMEKNSIDIYKHLIMYKLLTFVLVFFTVSATYAQKSKVVTAATLLSEGDIMEAREYIDAAFSSADVAKMAKAWITKAEIYADIYRFTMQEELGIYNPLEIADEAFRKAFELDMTAEKKPGKYKDRVKTGIWNTSIGHFEIAAAAFNTGDYDVAMKGFNMSGDVISFMLANGLVDEGDENPVNIQRDSYQNAALCALNMKDYDKAAEIYNVMVSEDLANDKVFANLASILISKSEFEAAKRVIDKGRELYPENASLIESELNYYIGTDQSEMAVDKLETAIANDPNNPDLFFNLALAYDKLGDKEKMVAAYEKIIEVDPSYYSAYLNLGAFYNEEANAVIVKMNEEPDWQKAIELEPERNAFYNKALPYLEKAYELHPDKEEVKRALERIYANLNMLDKIEELRGGE
jgi:tetratricopeptide (TPR) repeat protein